MAMREKAIWKLMKVPAEAQQVFEAVGVTNVKSRFNQWALNAPAYCYKPRFINKKRRGEW